jgi:hypothetical protein
VQAEIEAGCGAGGAQTYRPVPILKRTD